MALIVARAIAGPVSAGSHAAVAVVSAVVSVVARAVYVAVAWMIRTVVVAAVVARFDGVTFRSVVSRTRRVAVAMVSAAGAFSPVIA